MEFNCGSVWYKDNQILASFDSNPSTGFEWTAPIEGDAVEQAGDKTFVFSDKSGVAAGAPGLTEFSFKGVRAGDAVLDFKYARSWEDNAGDLYYQVQVTVGGAGKVTKMVGFELPSPLNDGIGGAAK